MKFLHVEFHALPPVALAPRAMPCAVVAPAAPHDMI
jgi:hypothetical protein